MKTSGGFPVLPWAIAAAALAALGWVWLSGNEEPAPGPVMRFTMKLAEDQPLDTAPIPMLAISPDGKRIAYTGSNGPDDVIYLRHTHQREATMLKGTEGADNPFFSPDGEWIGFEADGELKKVSVLGGPPATLCDAPYMRGATWGDDGTIVLTPSRSGGLARVSEAGGEPEALSLTGTEDRLGEATDRWPDFLPDGKTVIITHSENNNDYQNAEIQAFSLVDKSRKTLVKGGAFGRYVPPGFLVYMREGTLFAARFDPDTLELSEPAVPVLEEVSWANTYGSAHMTFSDDGTLLYLGGSAQYGEEVLTWIDRDGSETPASSHARDYGYADVSPSGTHVAVEIISDQSLDLWVLELARDTLTRVTFDDTRDVDPVWHPDGEWLTYSSMREDDSAMNLYRIRADGTGEPERLTTHPYVQRVGSWSPDGKVFAFYSESAETEADLMLYRPDGEPQTETFLETKSAEWLPSISPDGRWVLYASNRSDRPEIYVRPLSGDGQAVRVSTDNSPIARWTPDGKEILYRNLNGKLMAVRYSVENGRFKPELPRELFDFPAPPHSFIFDIAPDGRILSYKDSVDTAAAHREPVVVINWDEELEAKVPK